MHVRRAAAVVPRLASFATLAVAFLIAAPHASATERLERTGMFNGPVQAISEPDDNGVRYVGGDFTRFSPWATGAAISVDAATAALDTAFPQVAPSDGASWAAQVLAIEPDGAGGAYVGGRFGLVDGQVRYGLARILADGSVDPVWTASLGNTNLANDFIADIALHGGVVYVVGRFSAVASAPGGTTIARANAAAFDATTGVVQAWDPSPYGTSFNPAAALAIDTTASPARAFIGGGFACVNADPADFDCTDPGEVARNGLAVVNLTTGLVDPSFDAGLVSGATVEAVELDATGGWAYLGGGFSFSTPSRSNAAAVRTDGTNTVGAWDPDPSGGFARVKDLALVGSTVYLAGNFTQVAGVAREAVAAVSADPTQAATPTGLDTTFATGSALTNVYALAVDGGDVYVAGDFDTVGSETRLYAAKLAASDGAAQAWDPDLSPAVNGTGRAVAVDGGRIIVGGEFAAAGGEVRTYAAAVDSDGYLDDWSVAIDDEVKAIAVGHGRVYLGGHFDRVGGESRLKIAAVGTDGATVAGWNPDPNSGGDVVNAIAISGDVVYFGGSFTEFNCPTYPGTCVDPSSVAAFDRDGRQVTSWLPALSLASTVYALATAGSTIYIGGTFTAIDPFGANIPRRRAAAFGVDGTLDPAWDPDVDCDVYAIAVQASTTYLGGCFTEVDTTGTRTVRNYAAAFGRDGALDTTWDPDLDGDVYAIATTPSATYLGGSFGRVDDTGSRVVRNRAAAFTPAGGLLSWNPNANGDGLALAADPDAVYLGGRFTALGGGADARSYLAAIGSDGSILDPWPALRPSGTLAITVAKEGTGAGTVTSAPAGIDCGSTCSYAYRYGTRVTLTASPAAGSTFTGWGGACSGTATTCSLRTDQARNVTAAFAGSVGPEPTPVDDPSLRIVSIRQAGPLITVRVAVSAAGSVRTVGTVARRSGRTERSVVCRTARVVSAASAVTLRCRLNRVGRTLRARQALRVRLQTVYRPADGAATRSATRVVVLKRAVPDPHPVTG